MFIRTLVIIKHVEPISYEKNVKIFWNTTFENNDLLKSYQLLLNKK
jgi:hypothetical protein